MSPILLDLKTLSFVLVSVTAFLTFVIIFVRFTQKTYSGFGLWVISNIVIAVGILMVGFSSHWTDLIGTSLTFSAVLIAYEGNRQFLKIKKTYLISSIFFLFHTAALICFKVYFENIVWQIAFTSLMVGIVSGYCGFMFTRNATRKTMFSFKFTSITYYIFLVIMVSRSIITISTGDKNNFYSPDGIQPIFFILYILFEIVWTFNYINLNSNRLYNELERTQSKLEKLATTDFLTGTNNNRRFFEIGENEIKRAKRFRSSLSLVMFDVDFFKNVNDKYGHSAGDQVLIEIAETCRRLLRETDTLGRLGGEEFAIILPHTDCSGAEIVAEYLRSAIEDLKVKYLSENIRITASFGVTEISQKDVELKNALDRADILLYEAKNRGRNQIVSESLERFYKKLSVA